ncbi:hypothetical protein Ahia01_001295500 [Argonauta hians]
MASGGFEPTSRPSTNVTTAGFELIQRQFQDLMQLKDYLRHKTKELSKKNFDRLNNHDEIKKVVSMDLDNSKSSNSKLTEGSSENTMVPWKQYAAVVQELEIEKLNHSQTKSSWYQLADHLEISKHQVVAFQQQIQDDRESFRRILKSLNRSGKIEREKTADLEARFCELEEQNKELEDKLSSSNSEVKKLKNRLQKYKELQSRNLMELEVNRCQQDYISNYLDQSRHKKINQTQRK